MPVLIFWDTGKENTGKSRKMEGSTLQKAGKAPPFVCRASNFHSCPAVLCHIAETGGKMMVSLPMEISHQLLSGLAVVVPCRRNIKDAVR